LENFEKKVRQQISRNLIPLAYKQQQLSHQQCSLQGQAMLPKQA
jgi:hypothetical protein